MYTITVTNLNDSGTGTLRQAIADANAYNGTDEVGIVFDSSLSGTISLSSALNIPAGVLVNLPEGVTINLNGKAMNVYGALNAEWDTAADAINAATSYSYLYIQKGGKVTLTNANINLSNTSRNDVYVYDGGVLEMTGGSLYAGRYITVNGGGTMTLNGTTVKQYVTNSGTINLEDVTTTNYITGGGMVNARNSKIGGSLEVTGKSVLENVTCLRLNVDSDSDVTTAGQGVTMTGEMAFLLMNYSGSVEQLLNSISWTSTAENAYVGIHNSLNDVTLSALPDTLSGGYKSHSSVTINSGKTVTLEEGVCLQMQSDHDLNVYGTLVAENEEVADAIIGGSTSYAYLNIRDGGKLQLKNANVRNGYYLYIYKGGTLEMEGGTLDTRNYLYIQSGAMATLNGVAVNDYIDNAGTLTMTDSSISSYIAGSGTLTLEKVNCSSYIDCTGKLNAKDVTVSSYLAAFGNSTLEDVSCSTLHVDSVSDITTVGTGVTIRGTEVFRLRGFRGNVQEMLESFDWTATNEGAKYIGVSGNIYTSTLTELPDTFANGYKSIDNIAVRENNTVTLEEGVCLQMQSDHDLNVYGTLVAENEEVADAIIGGSTSYAYLNIRDGGKLQLKNANVRNGYYLYIYKGGTLEMEGGTLDTRNYLYIQSGATATLDGVTVKDYISNYGTLSLSNSIVNNTVYVYSGSSASITGCAINGALEISMGSTSTTITGNDFSKTTLKLTNMASSTGVIDLSGNYWGTTDIDEVIARIQNYTEDRVLISSILMAPPSQEFSFDASMVGRHRLSHLATSLTLSFNRLVDADTVNAVSILLTDADGNQVAVKRYEVSGKKVTLYFDALPTGDYQVNCTSELKDVDGKAFTHSENFSSGITYHCLEIAEPRVLLFRSNSTVTDVFSYVDVFFDQVMDDSTISLDSVHLYAPDGQEIELTQMRKAGVSGNIFYRFYFDTISAKGTYTLSVDQSVCNDWGLSMSSDYEREIYVSSPDLIVSNQINYTENRLGRYSTITYSVTNNGDGFAQGTWIDSIYLCKSKTWDEEQAVFFASVERKNQNIDVGESYTVSVRSLLNGLDFSEYYVFVKTDMSSRLSEGNENNNISATGTDIRLIGDTLNLGDASFEMSSANEVLYLTFTATENATMCFSVQDIKTRIYVSETLPTSGSTIASFIAEKNATSAYFAAEAGKTYNICLYPQRKGTICTNIRTVEFSLVSTSIAFIASGRTSTFKLVGAGFSENMDIWLEDRNGQRVNIDSIVVDSVCSATVSLTLSDENIDGHSFSIVAKDVSSGKIARLEDVLSVSSSGEDAIKVTYDNGSSTSIRRGSISPVKFNITNQQVYDIEGAIVLMETSLEDTTLQYSVVDDPRTMLMYLSGSKMGNAMVLEASGKENYVAYVYSMEAGTGPVYATVLSAYDDSYITQEVWEKIESSIKPYGVDNSIWTEWWNDMKPRIGSTIGEFVRYMGDLRTMSAADGVTCTTAAELLEYVLDVMPDYMPSLKILGQICSDSQEEIPLQQISVYHYVNGERTLFGVFESDDQGGFCISGVLPNHSYELSFSYAVEYGGERVRTLSVNTEHDDTEIEVLIHDDWGIEHEEMGVRLASNEAGNELRVVLRDSNLYADNVREESDVLVLLSEPKNIQDYSLRWSEYHQSYILLYMYTEEDELKNSIVLLRPNGSSYLVSNHYDLPSGNIEDIYITEDGDVVFVSSSIGSLSKDAVDLSFSHVDVSDIIESFEESVVVPVVESEYMSGNYLKKDKFTISRNVAPPWQKSELLVGVSSEVSIWRENDVVHGSRKISVGGSVGWDANFRPNKFDPNKGMSMDLRMFAKVEFSRQVTSWYDCETKQVLSKTNSCSGGITVGFRDDYGAVKLLGPAGTMLKKLIHHASRWNINVIAGYIVQGSGQITWNENYGIGWRLSLEDSGAYGGIGVSLGVGGNANDVLSESKVDVGATIKGSITLNGYVESRNDKTESDITLSGGIEVSFHANVRLFNRLKASAEILIGWSTDDGITFEIDYDFSWGKEKNSTSGISTVYEKQIQDVFTYTYEDVRNGDYAGNGSISAYAYMTTDGAVSVNYFNAQTQTPHGDEVKITIQDDDSLFCGFSNIQHLDAETDGDGRVYLAASGFLTQVDTSLYYTQGVAQTGKTDLYAMFGSSQLETIVVDESGEYSLLDQSSLQCYDWNGQLVNTTQNAKELDAYYLDGQLGMVWVTSPAPGVNQVYASILQNDVWQTPTLLYSSVNELGGCFIEEVNGEFYVNFTELVQMSEEGSYASSYVFVWENGDWNFDESVNTEQGNTSYEWFVLGNVVPVLNVTSPELQRLSSGETQLRVTWSSSCDCSYVVVVDGIEYEVGSATEFSMNVSSGGHIVMVRATTIAGVSVSSEEFVVESDDSAPVLMNIQRSVYNKTADGFAVRWNWVAADVASTVLVVDGVEHEIENGKSSFDFELGAGNHEYELQLFDASSNVTKKQGQFVLEDTMSTLEILQPKCEILDADETLVTFRWSGAADTEYSISIDSEVYYVGKREEYTIRLADGKHEYELIGETAYGEVLTSSGYLETNTNRSDLILTVLSTDAAADGQVRTRVIWNDVGLIDAVLSDGTTQHTVTGSHIYEILTTDGCVELTIEGTDVFGNVYEGSVSFRYDASAPKLLLNDVTLGVLDGGEHIAYFTWECSDISHCEYALYLNDKLVYEGDIQAYAAILTEPVRQWRVEARDAYGYTSVASAECDIEPVEGLLVSVSEINGEDEEIRSYCLTWNEIKGAEYEVYINNEYYFVGSETCCSLTLSPGAFEYRVTALLENGLSVVSNGSLGNGELQTIECDNYQTNGWFDDEDIQFKNVYSRKLDEGKSLLSLVWEQEYDASVPRYDAYDVIVDNRYRIVSDRCLAIDVGDGMHSIRVAGVKDGKRGPFSEITYYTDATSPIINNFSWSYNTFLFNEIELDWRLSEDADVYVVVNGVEKHVGNKNHYEFRFAYNKTYNVTVYAKDKYGNISNTLSDTIEVLRAKPTVDVGFIGDIMSGVESSILTNQTESYVKVPLDCKPKCKENEVLQNGKCVKVIIPVDPNDIYGPEGYGVQNWIGLQEMMFEVVCENIPEENIAHAAMVTIKQQIDEAYDYSTFRLGDMMIGGNYIEVSEDVQNYKARLDWTSTLGVWVDVNAFFDADTGLATWEFVAVDPETGFMIADPFKGLLAPNYNPPEGDGGVKYYVTPKETTASGTVMQSQAEIVFDFNEPIMTPVLSYTFDADRPEGAVTAVAATACTRYLRVDWSGTDVGSGVACYNVFVSVDGGDWELWQENISATSALFTVAEGEHRYAFFAQAIDNVGLAEALGEMMPAEAETTASGKVSSLSVENVQAVRAGDELTLSIAFSEQAVCADWAAALLVSTSAQNIDLSTGTFRYDATTHVLTWVGTVAGVPDGAQATVRLTDGAVTDAAGLPFGSTVPAYTAPIELAGVLGSTYAAPALVDYNGDGLLDVLVGEVAENGKGRIRIYLNEGTAEVASFASFIYASTAEDTPMELAATGCQGAIVRLADITGDGKDEMVVGLADGTIRIFTAAEGGYWADSGELSCSVGGESGIVDAGTRAAIEFVDANGDGRTDMLVGTGDGNVLLYLNSSAEGAAAFDAGRYLHDAAGRIDVGSRATVATGDFDGDGLWDMLLGTADGTVLFYRNEGTTATPLFGAAETVFAGDALLDMSSETNRVRIAAGDLNGDGIDDLVVGQSDGKVKLLYGTDGADLIGEVVVGSIPLPGVPKNVQMMVDGSALTISWDAVAVDEAADISYELSYIAAGAEEPTVVAVSGTETTLELPDGVYSVQVRALNHGKGGDWSIAQNVTVDTVAPEVPGGVSAEGGETQAVLSWVAVAEAASYELRYRKSGSEVWRTVSGTEASVTLESLDPADYVWQVRAVDAAGNASEWSANSIFTVTGVLPDTEQHWANGLRFDASGAVTGGYYDVNKIGSGDSNLCWAAAASNMLAWWQEQGMTTTVVSDAPQGAEAIYATFSQSWENSSGVDVYGLIWWLSGDSTSSGYDDYVDAHYRGDSTTGAYYEQFYTPQTISQHTAQVPLADVAAETLSAAWADIFDASGMIALGIFRSVGSGGSLSGGHSLTLWGFETNLDTGRVQEIYVTDSDDNTTALETLAVEYDEQTGYYTVSQDGARLNGYVLGTYTYLKSFTDTDVVSPEVTVEAPVTEKLANGRIRVTFRWSCSEAAACVLTVDGQTYNVGSETSYTLELADGEHAYSITATDAAGNSGSAMGSFALDATAPAVVQGVQAITDESGVAVSWDAVEDAASYTLEYATKADFSDAQSVTGITGTSYALTDVPGTGTLYVRVAAADTAGNVSDWSASAQTGLDITAPVVTLNEPEVKKIADGRIAVTFSWSCSESAVYTLTVDGTEYSVRGATRYTLELADGEHVYSVKATDGAGLTGTAEGSFAMDATAPAVVQGVQAITGENGVAVSWDVVEEAASYTLEYATKPDFSDAKSVTGISDTKYALTDVPGTGTLYVRVASADAAGNVSAWSAVAESALDITAPGAVQGLEVMAHGTSARLSWDAVSDASGIAGYRIEYAVDGDFTKAQSMQVNSTEATFYTLLAGAAYQWRVAAVDGAGNVGAWTVGEAFRTGAAEPGDDSTAESREIIMTVPSGGESHSTTRVNGWVGFDDPADYYCFTAKGEGAYAINLDAAALGTQVYLSVGTLDDKGNFVAEKKLLVAPGSAAAALGGIALESGEKCYIRVESYDKGLGRYNGEYSLSVNAEVADAARVTDNNSTDKATMLQSGDSADAALSGWVGTGDAVDYYCFELENPAELSLVLGELDAAVKVKLLREERDGGISQVMSRAVKASRGLDHTLSLTSGTYFVEVASYDNGAGRYNTSYALELEKEEENGETKRFTLASA